MHGTVALTYFPDGEGYRGNPENDWHTRLDGWVGSELHFILPSYDTSYRGGGFFVGTERYKVITERNEHEMGWGEDHDLRCTNGLWR